MKTIKLLFRISIALLKYPFIRLENLYLNWQLKQLIKETAELTTPYLKQIKKDMNNSIMIIHPYWKYATWVFDDEATGLVAEPFVSGIPKIIDELLNKAGIGTNEAEGGFTATFSATPFPEYTGVLNHIESDEHGVGNWYQYEDMKGWLCPALFKYFSEAPKQIYVKVQL